MRELSLKELCLVTGGDKDAAAGNDPWWAAFDYNGDGDLWDEGAIWFGGVAAGLGLAAGGMAVTGVGAPVAGAVGIAAGISGAIGGVLVVGDYYFGNKPESTVSESKKVKSK